MRRITTFLLGIVAVLMVLVACQHELHFPDPGTTDPFSLTVMFNPVVNNAPLQFNTPYLNALGERYTVTAFKFYIHDLRLVNTTTNSSIALKPGEHYLVDADYPVSQRLTFEPAGGDYNAISLTIGVDSLRNFSGAQTGALDPTHGMFWTWNSGYIMAKLEGKSPLSQQPNQAIEYHIGGYKAPYSVLKKVLLPFPANTQNRFPAGTASTVSIEAQADAFFSGANPIRIATTSVCMTPGELSLQIADNYSKMLRISQVKKN